MARGALQSDVGDRLRARASVIAARAAELETRAVKADRLDAEKQAKARDAAAQKADKANKEALADPKKMAAKTKISVGADGHIGLIIDGERLEYRTAGGNYDYITKGQFQGVFKELSSSAKSDFTNQLVDKGMDEKSAKKAVELIGEKAAKAAFGNISVKKVLQNKESQAEINKAFQDLDAKVANYKSSVETAQRYSSSPSDDGSYNLYAYEARRSLDNHVAYVNRLRDEIGSIDIGIQYGEKTVNKQTEDWIERLVYGGALEQAYKKHRDLFID